MNYPGTLYVIAAPSGAGKTSLVHALVKDNNDIQISISFTTRMIRPAEREGIDYHFVSVQEFQKMVAADLFLEHAEVHGSHYGTAKAWVDQTLATGKDVILEIDWQGALQVRNKYPGCVGIFILPPSLNILAERLQTRQQDPAAVIQRRLAAANSEMRHYFEFDYLIINEHFEQALQDLKSIMQAQRLRQSRQAQVYAALLQKLCSV